jgi:hypothetical protein
LLVDRFEPGLRHAASEAQVERDMPTIEPGQSKRLKITLEVTQPGPLAHTVEIRSSDAVVASARAKLTAGQPPAAEPKTPPKARPIDEPPPLPGPREEPAPAEGPKPLLKPAAPKATPAPEQPAVKPAPGSAFPEMKPDNRPPGAEEEPERGPDLGPPLVENAGELKRLHAEFPVWIDRTGARVVVIGSVCQRQTPLELFACVRGSKEHESVLSVPVKASLIHVGLLAVGAEAGSPAQFQPKYVPARGTEIEVGLVWKDAKGKLQTARGQDWVRNAKTKKALEHPWVFAGSRFYENPVTKTRYYQADAEGDLICVSNFPSAALDLTIASTADDADLLYEAFTENIPPRGTPVTVLLTPKAKKPAEPAKGQP